MAKMKPLLKEIEEIQKKALKHKLDCDCLWCRPNGNFSKATQAILKAVRERLPSKEEILTILIAELQHAFEDGYTRRETAEKLAPIIHKRIRGEVIRPQKCIEENGE